MGHSAGWPASRRPERRRRIRSQGIQYRPQLVCRTTPTNGSRDPKMTELERIADQLQRAYAGKAWYGPSVLEALEGVTPEIAARHSIVNAHSIWELAHHIGAWADIPRRRIV